MAKKVEKKVQRVETAKVSERFKNEKTTSIEDLKMKLSGVKNEDIFSHLKDRLISSDDDPLSALKKSLMSNSEDESNLNNEVKEEMIENILDDYDIKSEEEIIENIVEVEKQEENIETQKYEEAIEEFVEEVTEYVIDEIVEEHVEEVVKEEYIEEVVEEIVQEIIEDIIEEVKEEDVEKYQFKYKDSYNNNILVREVEKRKNEKMVIHIALNNLEHENYIRKTSEPFEVYHNGAKILDFYQFKKDTSISYNFKKDIYILRNNLVIDSKTYLLEEIDIVNIKL